MASIIKIKRSGENGVPAALASGELAYSWKGGVDKLYVGWGSETQAGIADNISPIGGKYYTDLLDVTFGTLTASKPIIVDADKKINELLVDNLSIDGNTISSTNTDGNILLDPTGSGYVQVVGTNGLIIPVGTTAQRGPTTTGTIRYNTSTSQFEGYSGSNWSSLGGVRSVDGLTFIVAELTPGQSDDTLYFYTATGTETNKIAMELDQTSLTVLNTTDASSSTTGSVIVGGGVGIAKKLYVGTDLHVLGNSYIGNAVTDIVEITGDVTISLPDDDTVAMDIKQSTNSYIRVVTTDAAEEVIFGTTPTVRIANTTAATGNDDGALVVAGGVDIGGALVVGGSFVGGNSSFTDINGTPIGNNTPSTGAFTSLESQSFEIVTSLGATVYSLPTVDGTGGHVLTTNGSGVVSFAAPKSLDFTVGSTTVTAAPLTGGVTITGSSSQGITPSVSGSAGSPIINVTAENASTTQKGVASFNTSNFTVSSGAVTAKNITLGTSTLTLGSTTTDVAGLTSAEIDNIRIDSNVISSIDGVDSNVDIVLDPKGTGTVDVSSTRITSVADPVNETDAANKRYVDDVAQGLKALPAAYGATTGNLNASYTDGPDAQNPGVGSTLTANTNSAFPQVDGITDWAVGKNILVKDQTNAAHNGSYIITDMGEDGVSPWEITRCDFCNEPDEIAGAYEFVTNGSTNANTGWVASVPNSTIIVGTTEITWIQFSGAGTYTGGDGLDLTGTVFSVNVPAAGAGGLEIVADNVQVAPTIAGNGLTYSSGVVAVVGTADRVSVTADTVDIASTYVGQTSITTLGTISTGTWEGDVVEPTYGGTGVNNGSSTITIGGNFTMSGAYTFTGTLNANTAVTFPSTGTLATLTNSETISNKTITNSSIGSANPSTAAFTTLTANNNVTFTNTTDATALGTAPVVMSGGLSVAKKLYVGTNIVGNGTTSDISGFTIDGGTY